VWKNVKHDRIAKMGVTSKDDLKAKATNALRRLQKLPHGVIPGVALSERRVWTLAAIRTPDVDCSTP
jgi:hypothetical protein